MQNSLGSMNPYLKRIRNLRGLDAIAGWVAANPQNGLMNLNRAPNYNNGYNGNGGNGMLVLPGGPNRQPGNFGQLGYPNGNGNGNGYPPLMPPGYGNGPVPPGYGYWGAANCGWDPASYACGEDYMYGLDSGSANIAALASATISVSPQKRHVPQRMSISENMANTFVVTDIRVGVEPVLITTGAISASVFIQDATAPNFRSVVCEVGNTVSITVTNITGATARFTATVIGRALPIGG